jgi:hypothetical protein
MTQTLSPADLLGLGIAAVRPCTGMGAPIASAPGTGLTFVGTAVRMRPQVRQADVTAFAHNYIAVTNDGTPLGIHPSGRPTS